MIGTLETCNWELFSFSDKKYHWRKTIEKIIYRKNLEPGYMKNCKMARLPCLKPHHKEARLHWATQHMSFGDMWLNVIFSDEKNGIWTALMDLQDICMIFEKNQRASLVDNMVMVL
ncbi:hypothetical protein AVEN_77350-1 [Araneus ventricosus]|uniref:Transposase Tc1-like domain-containing protein n=1 Tax=Araneus ventricosus TaxID=182803 RepID=A0A4Y2C8Q2_ARAVE|nr:hypothetical protein AVEN_77350-1 [Araneus ventricosus]